MTNNEQDSPNIGHKILIQDLTSLLEEAGRYEFHDFKNTIYAAPKAKLIEKLLKIQQNVRDGIYDN